MSGPSGGIPTRYILEDYREVDGVRLPFRTRIQIVEQERVVQVESIRHNVELEGDPFAVPAAVQTFLEQQKQTGSDE
jgi:hypothetical protein